METRSCTVCDKPYQPVRIKQFACSLACRTKRSNRLKVDRERAARYRQCAVCGEWFDGLRGARTCSDACYYQLPEVKERRRETLRRWYRNQDNEVLRRKANLVKYGLSDAEYESLLIKQGGRCAICGNLPDPSGKGSAARLHIDHDHVTNLNRALLCCRCNPGIGYFQDDPALLRAAADYIEKHREKVLADGTSR